MIFFFLNAAVVSIYIAYTVVVTNIYSKYNWKPLEHKHSALFNPQAKI